MKYCSNCASELEHKIPDKDNLPRFICPSCAMIHYENPRVIVGCLPVFEDKILLCKRAIEPRYGYWTLPCGFLENGETTEDGAARETIEEANAIVEISHLYCIYNVPQINQVHLIYYASLPKPEFSPGIESLEVQLFEPAQLPMADIAFHSIRFALNNFIEFGSQPQQVFRGSTLIGAGEK